MICPFSINSLSVDISFAKDKVGIYPMTDSYDFQLSGISLLVKPLATNWPLTEYVWEKIIQWKENKITGNKKPLIIDIKLYI